MYMIVNHFRDAFEDDILVEVYSLFHATVGGLYLLMEYNKALRSIIQSIANVCTWLFFVPILICLAFLFIKWTKAYYFLFYLFICLYAVSALTISVYKFYVPLYFWCIFLINQTFNNLSSFRPQITQSSGSCCSSIMRLFRNCFWTHCKLSPLILALPSVCWIVLINLVMLKENHYIECITI